MADLTWIEIGAQARRMGHDDLADWIMTEQGRRENERTAKLTQPLSTPVGELLVGHTYNVKVEKKVWPNKTQVETLRKVRFERRPAPVDGTYAQLVYGSGKKVTIWTDTVILAIEELTE